MKAKLKHKQSETLEVVKVSDSWSGDVAGFRVEIVRPEDAATKVLIAPLERDEFRLPLLCFYPDSVAEIEKLAETIGPVLRQIASEMRVAGLNDLRMRRAGSLKI